jgi:hypothetical protein
MMSPRLALETVLGVPDVPTGGLQGDVDGVGEPGGIGSAVGGRFVVEKIKHGGTP